MKMLKVNKNVYIPVNQILAVLEFRGRANTRFYKDAKESKMLIDATMGKAIKCLILMKDKYVVTCPFALDTLLKRLDENADSEKEVN